MPALESLLLPLLLLLWSSVYQQAAGAGLNVTEQEQDLPTLGTPNKPATEMVSSGVDYKEEDIKEVMAPQFLVSDSGRGELQLKKPEKPEGGKKNSNKQKKKGNKEKKNKKKNRTPCEGEFKNFCVHGECKYIENLQAVRCKCLPDYFGERCVEQFLKTHRSDDNATSNSLLASIVGVVVGLTLLCFAIIVIVIIVQVRKKCPKYDEKEERKKLRHENRSCSNGV
ncbi:amphiregulin [Sceloporus undulatus]|uniref:amphiregulin n=1 Tax=Sceloporus undulatus TaxID=8520 RepID=UPI001C4A8910|nr:amphiregulin [Sceloporus undulatus]